MEFDYKKDTKDHYKSDDIATNYYNAYTHDSGWKAFRFQIVAYRERLLVGRYLRRVSHKRILDIPSGTGKLAVLFKEEGCWVKACDISDNMLSISKNEYKEIQHSRVEFQICDAEKITEILDDHFDLAVCLRLLHRVPDNVKTRILCELAGISDHSIVSFGVESSFHKLRRLIRKIFFGGGTDAPCYSSIKSLRKIIGEKFEVLDCCWIIPWVSQEMLFLIRPRTK